MATLGFTGIAEQDLNMLSDVKVKVSEVKVIYTHNGYILTMRLEEGGGVTKTLVTRRNPYKPRLFKKFETLQEFILQNCPYIKEYKIDISAMNIRE